MQQLVAEPATQPIDGAVDIPADKSITHRALILSAITETKVVLYNWLQSTDCLATLQALLDLGGNFTRISELDLSVVGVGRYGFSPATGPLNLQNSGTGIRLLAGLLSAMPFASTLVGDDSLARRPQDRIIIPLSKMGAQISAQDGKYAPITIKPAKQLMAIEYTLPVASAQVKSAILLASMYADGKSKVIENCVSRDHTERMLQYFALHTNCDFEYRIPGDISSAAFFIAAAAMLPNSKLYLPNVGVNPTRTGIIDILRMMGASIVFCNYREEYNEPVADIYVEYRPLIGVKIPATMVPRAIDEFPILFVIATVASGITHFAGLEELKVKESDRLQAMVTGLRILGAELYCEQSSLAIYSSKLSGGVVDALADHRIAMSLAIAAIVADGKILINNCENIGTSFPNFVKLAQKLGLNFDLPEMNSKAE